MKNTKKGFTLVELLVVIAIIAILATVSIVSYVSFINRANMSVDQQGVTQMNKVLEAAEIDQTIETVDQVKELLIANNYNGDLTTYHSGYELAWIKADNVIVLVENDVVVYPEAYAGKTDYIRLTPFATDADSLTSGLVAGETLYVTSNITTGTYLGPETAGIYSISLNGNTLNASNWVGAWAEDAKLVVSNGVIDGSSIADAQTVVYVTEGGEIELNNIQVYAPAAYNPLQCYGGTMVLNNVTTAQTGEAATSWYNSAIQVINTIKKEEGREKTYTIYGEQAHTTINGGMYTGDKAVQISAPGGNVTINGGTFTGTTYVIQDDFVRGNYNDSANYESVITINGGNLTGNIKVSADTVLVINGGTFTGDTFRVGNTTVKLTAEVLAPYVTTGSTIVVNGVSFTK